MSVPRLTPPSPQVSDIRLANRLLSDIAIHGIEELLIPTRPLDWNHVRRTPSPQRGDSRRGATAHDTLSRLQESYALRSAAWEFTMSGGIYDSPPTSASGRQAASGWHDAPPSGSGMPGSPRRLLRLLVQSILHGDCVPAAASIEVELCDTSSRRRGVQRSAVCNTDPPPLTLVRPPANRSCGCAISVDHYRTQLALFCMQSSGIWTLFDEQ
jgi:hypothetical protein